MSGDCSVNVVAGQSVVVPTVSGKPLHVCERQQYNVACFFAIVAKLVTDGTGRDINTGGEGTATFEGIMSMAHDPISDTLYVGVSVHKSMPCCLMYHN
eukprot:scaffold48561_cov20-Tisochrysis_lutea.AAC.1